MNLNTCLKISAIIGLLAGTLLFARCKNISLGGELGKYDKYREGAAQVATGASELLSDLPVEDEITIGRATSARVIKVKGGLVKKDRMTLNKYVNFVGRAVARQSEYDRTEFHFGILKKKERNAYSTPGGFVFVSRGIFPYIKDEAELAGVLAHEVAHIELAHIVQEINSKRDSEGFSNIVGGAQSLGEASGALEDGSQDARRFVELTTGVATGVLFQKGFPPEQELGADQLAVKLVARAGYDPMGLVRFLKRQRRNNPQQSGKTHPATRTRIQKLQNYIRAEGLGGNGKKLTSRYHELTGF